MTSLVYDLPITGFDARRFERLASYACSGDYDRLAISLTENELLAEFGQVPASVQVIVRGPDGTPPADTWLDKRGGTAR
jgi:hypothetical protein